MGVWAGVLSAWVHVWVIFTPRLRMCGCALSVYCVWACGWARVVCRCSVQQEADLVTALAAEEEADQRRLIEERRTSDGKKAQSQQVSSRGHLVPFTSASRTPAPVTAGAGFS